MTPQEQQLLQGLVQRIQGTQLPGKDADAEQYIRQSLGSNPDSLYILCQTVLVQQYALDQAQKQLADARQQIGALQQAGQGQEQHTSFLGKLFGGGDAPQLRPGVPSQPQYAPVNYAGAPQGYGAPPQGYGQPQYMPAPSTGMFGGGGYGGGGFGGGGFLQGALQTAAGVAAGELAFRGIEDLMHGFGHEAGYGSDRALGGFGDRSDFSGNDRDSDRDSGDSFSDRLQSADGSPGRLSPDIEDRRGDGGRGFFGGDDASGADGFSSNSDDTIDDGSTGFDDDQNDAGGDGGGDDGGSMGGDDSGGGGGNDSF